MGWYAGCGSCVFHAVQQIERRMFTTPHRRAGAPCPLRRHDVVSAAALAFRVCLNPHLPFTTQAPPSPSDINPHPTLERKSNPHPTLASMQMSARA